MFDADRLFDPYRNGFFCENCSAEVADNSQEEDEGDGMPMSQNQQRNCLTFYLVGKGQKMQRYNARTERIVSLLKKTDEIVLPK